MMTIRTTTITLGIAIEETSKQRKGKAGVRVVGVVSGGSAGLAGIEVGDFITSFNSVPCTSSVIFASEQKKYKVFQFSKYRSICMPFFISV